MSTIEELRSFIRECPTLVGHESEFIYAVHTIDASEGIYADLGILGEPFSGKRQFCLALKRWFDRVGKRCGLLRMEDNSAFEGDIVFLLDSDSVDDSSTWLDKRRQRVASFASQSIFVVYTSVAKVFGSGETITLKELKRDDFFRMIGEVTGYGNEVAAISDKLNIPAPTSLLIAKSVCNRLLGVNAMTPDIVGEVLDMQSRQRRATSIIPRTELDLWRSRFVDKDLETWKATRCGIRFFIMDESLVSLGLASKDGSGIKFSEAMCALAHGIWGEPDGSDYRNAMKLNIEALHSGYRLPQIFFDDAIRLSTSVLVPEMAMNIGLDFVFFYIMELVRHRVYDKNRPLSCMVLLQNAKSLKDIKDIFNRLENELIQEGHWDNNLKDALDRIAVNNPSYGIDRTKFSEIKGFIAMEVKVTISSKILKRIVSSNNGIKTDPIIDGLYRFLCDVIGSFENGRSFGVGSYSPHGLSESKGCYDRLLHEMRRAIDFIMLDVEETFKEEKDCDTRTVMGFQKTIIPKDVIESNSRQSPWVHLLWDEFEVNARWVNLKTVYGYADSAQLIRRIDYIHQVNRTYPLNRFKPVNDEIDFSSITMYSELLNPEMFNVYEKFREHDPTWYGSNYKLKDFDRSIIYYRKSECRVRWEKAEEWKDVYEVWEKVYGDAEKAKDRNDDLMHLNLLRDLFHYFRLYCEYDAENMGSMIGKMEIRHRGLDPGPKDVGYALITLELCRAELLCGHTVKSMEYLDIVKTMEANGEVDANSTLYKVAFMDAEARLEYTLGKTRSAIRKMEDMRAECMINGFVSQYVISGKHLYKMYGSEYVVSDDRLYKMNRNGGRVSSNSSRRISMKRLYDELDLYVKKLMEPDVGKRFELILNILGPWRVSDSKQGDTSTKGSETHEGTDDSKDSSSPKSEFQGKVTNSGNDHGVGKPSS